MKFCDIFWKIIEKHNIKQVFGLPGAPILNILYNKPNKIKWENTGNELNDGFISQIYGKYTNNVGLLFLTSGPGIATAISAIANAYYEDLPLVTVSVFSDSKEGFQIWDIKHIAKNITKYTFIINTSEELINKLYEALFIAKNLNTSVIVLINKILIDKNEDINLIQKNIYLSQNLKIDDKNYIVKYINKINNLKNLLVVIGKIPNANFTYVNNFLLNNKLPYITTWKERTIFNREHYCGRLGSLGNHSANYAIYHAKNLLIIGDTSSILHEKNYSIKYSTIFTENKSNIYCIVNKENDAINGSTKIFINSDYNYILKNIKINTNQDWLLKLNISNTELLFNLEPKTLLEKYCNIACLVYNNHNLNIPVVTGVGNHWYAFGKFFNPTNLYCWSSSTAWASIGCGYTYGIGAYLGTKKPVWIIEGDGGTLFSGNILFYLIKNKNYPLTITIFDDNQYSAIVQAFDNIQNNISKVYNIDYDILPNCYHFYNIDDYYTYLNKNPISDILRFIIIHIKKSNPNKNSFVYEIDITNKKYIDALKNSDYNKIKNLPQVDKIDSS